MGRSRSKRASGWWFESGRFASVAPTEEPPNRGRFGRSLADWLAAELRTRGWEVREVFPEDWGWVVEVRVGPHRLDVGCGNADGSVTRWAVRPEARGGLLQRVFAGSKPTSELLRLDEEIGDILRSDPQTTWIGRNRPE